MRRYSIGRSAIVLAAGVLATISFQLGATAGAQTPPGFAPRRAAPRIRLSVRGRNTPDWVSP